MFALTAAPAHLAIESPKVRHETREGWLLAAVEALAPLFAEVGITLPTVRVSVGWPGGAGKKDNVIGQCWSRAAAEDGVSNLFISPALGDAQTVLATLVHELIHAVDDCQSGHKGAFRKYALALGLAGKMTATVPGPALAGCLDALALDLGVYPHGRMVTAGGKGKGRMLKIACDDCGFIAYTTRKWIDTYGDFPCPCGGCAQPASE